MKIVSTVIFVILLTITLGWLMNQPQNVGLDVPQGKLNSLSFAPFWEGQGPLEGVFPTVEQIDSDLQLMSTKTHSIRTYASAEGTMPEIPALARKHGLAMIQGAWLGGIKKGNKLEVDELIRSANANPDVVKRVIVGNEVLLRGDLEPEELVQYIREVKKSVKQPVSYADVWSMYMKYPALIKEVDFITIHILPYWEDEPIAVDEAPAHIERIYKHVQKEAENIAPNKPILIGESGWPSEGRQRGWAIPSVVNEAMFIRGLIKVANTNGFDYNIVEAINQSWKSELEGVVGANWGLFSVDRNEVFPLTGKVYENSHWYKGWALAIMMFVIIVVVFHKQFKPLPMLVMVVLLLFLQSLILLWVNQIELLWYTSYSIWQRLLTVVIAGSNFFLMVGLMLAIYGLSRGQMINRFLQLWLYRIYLFVGSYAAYKTAALAFNGRYISFPNLTFSILVFGILGVIVAFYSNRQKLAIQSVVELLGNVECQGAFKWLGYVLISTGVALVLGETLAFVQSRDLILAYPAVWERLFKSLAFTLTNQQLIEWLISVMVISLPSIAYKKA